MPRQSVDSLAPESRRPAIGCQFYKQMHCRLCFVQICTTTAAERIRMKLQVGCQNGDGIKLLDRTQFRSYSLNFCQAHLGLGMKTKSCSSHKPGEISPRSIDCRLCTQRRHGTWAVSFALAPEFKDLLLHSKKHQKRLSAPSHWLLDKLSGAYAPKASPGPHKLRDCMPLIIFLRNRLESCSVNVDGVNRSTASNMRLPARKFRRLSCSA